MAAVAERPDQYPISLEALAKLCRLDKRTVQKHAEAGIFVKIRHGKYDMFASVGNYCEHLSKIAAGRRGDHPEIDAMTENALLKRAHRETIELKRSQLAGRLISIEELTDLWGTIVKSVRQMVVSWPGQCAAEMPHLTPHDLKRMKEIANDLLESNTLPAAMKLPEAPKDVD